MRLVLTGSTKLQSKAKCGYQYDRVTFSTQGSKLPSPFIHHSRLLLLPPFGTATWKKAGKTAMGYIAAHPGHFKSTKVGGGLQLIDISLKM